MDKKKVVEDIIDTLAKAGELSHIPGISTISHIIDTIVDSDIDKIQEHVIHKLKELGHM